MSTPAIPLALLTKGIDLWIKHTGRWRECHQQHTSSCKPKAALLGQMSHSYSQETGNKEEWALLESTVLQLPKSTHSLGLPHLHLHSLFPTSTPGITLPMSNQVHPHISWGNTLTSPPQSHFWVVFQKHNTFSRDQFTYFSYLNKVMLLQHHIFG